MHRVLLTLILCTAVATVAYSAPQNQDALPGIPGDSPNVRSDIPAIASFVVGGSAGQDVLCLGIGAHAGLFFVTGSDFDQDGSNGSGDNGIYIYDQSGAFVGGLPQPTLDVWGWRDSGYDGTHFMFGASSPHAGRIFYVNATTLAVDQEFGGCGLATCRALAVELAGGGLIQYKVSDFSSDIETHVWTVGNPNSVQSSSCGAPATGPYGLAYDSGAGSIWLSTATTDGFGDLYQLDPGTCGVQALWDQAPEVDVFGGAAMANTSAGCNLWTICQCDPNDLAYGWATGGDNPYACGGATAVEPATWGSIKANYND